ncbi:hypothetical protein LQ567_14285 [Niabella pedocola]|uniref:DUF5004 domain-containing protein n=1 Tax=Niabella pedocola TaxID=1752077 RepID=A0ABS8PS89_9BACT|nr:hypothetical protein [Niabella pedocola]MCD2423942.1 hypothetical protein [Niabella pedocola]
MKNKKILLAVMMLITAAACSKTGETNNEKDAVDNTTRPDSNIVKQDIVMVAAPVGSWQLSETRISPGVLVDWGKVPNGPVLTFKDSSSYEINGDKSLLWPNIPTSNKGTAGLTNRVRSTVIYLLPANSRDTAFFNIRVSKDTLELSGMFCVEGCAYRFRKIE